MRQSNNGNIDTRMPVGTYKENPAETMRICELEGCHRSFHHSGFAPHVRACQGRTPEEREQYMATKGKYYYKQKGKPKMAMLPVRITELTSAAPTKALARQLPAPVSIATVEGERVALKITVERKALMNLFNTLKFE